MNRRLFLELTGAGIIALLGGCSSDSQDPNRTQNTVTATPTSTTTSTQTATSTPEPIPQTGSINFSPEGGAPSHQLFEGEVDLATLARDEDYTMPSMQELREKYHFQQVDRIAEGIGGENGELLTEFPRKITDEQWRIENIIEPVEEKVGADIEDLFETDELMSGPTLVERWIDSHLSSYWKEAEKLVKDAGVSSTNDYMRTAALAATEYFTVGNNTFTSHMKTLDGSHGLGIAMTGLTYDPSKASEQKIYGIETDPSESKQIWPLQEGYVNRPQNIPIDEVGHAGNELQWLRLGFLRGDANDIHHETGDANISLEVEGIGEYVDFKRNPEDYVGMKFVDSMILASYIDDEAHEDGDLPELEGATVRVTPAGLNYSLAS